MRKKILLLLSLIILSVTINIPDVNVTGVNITGLMIGLASRLFDLLRTLVKEALLAIVKML